MPHVFLVGADVGTFVVKMGRPIASDGVEVGVDVGELVGFSVG